MDKNWAKWTEREESVLMELYKNKTKGKDIAKALGRTEYAIKKRISKLKKDKQNNRILIDSVVPAIAVTKTDDNIAKIKKYIENIITSTYINDALVGDNTRLKNKNQKLASALTEAKNIIEEALKDEPISSDNGGTTAI